MGLSSLVTCAGFERPRVAPTEAGGRITLRAESAGDAVRFSVSDTGQGIPNEHLSHLCERFWQAQKGSQSRRVERQTWARASDSDTRFVFEGDLRVEQS
ncbi:MAG: ATP-binding protein [Longimicrobiales bacterium]